MPVTWPRPATDEYHPFYAGYVALVPDGPALEVLGACLADLERLLAPLDEPAAGFRYAEGKWSVREVVGHMADAERVFAYRLLRFARADETPLPGFDEGAWMTTAAFDQRPLADLVAEFASVRRATMTLVGSLGEDALMREGLANGHRVTVRALLAMLIGHERHHTAILRERYGLG